MPIPGTTIGTPTTPVVSTDHVLTVTPDAVFPAAGVKVDFSQASGTGAAVTVTVLRDGQPVRGLDGTFAPRGIVAGYDPEPGLGASCVWRAYCYDASGTLIATSGAVSVLVPRSRLMWLVCLSVPELSVGLIAEQYPKWSRPRAVGLGYALNAAAPSVSAGTRRLGAGTLSVHTQNVTEMAEMLALQNATDPVWMLRPDATSSGFGAADCYVAVGDVDEGWDIQSSPWRTWAVPMTQTTRPITAGSVVAIPGGTFFEAPAVPVSTLSGRIVDWAGH